jgi:hypothetical protein
MSSKLDMTAMYAAHDALRREMELLARTAARVDDDPRRILGTAVGWELFKKSLHVHHTAEDDALWPAMHEAAADHPDDLTDSVGTVTEWTLPTADTGAGLAKVRAVIKEFA